MTMHYILYSICLLLCTLTVRLHFGTQTTTASAAGKSYAGSIPAAAASGCGGGGTIPESIGGPVATQRRRSLNRVLDNRDLRRIISSFIPERNYRS